MSQEAYVKATVRVSVVPLGTEPLGVCAAMASPVF